MSASGKSDYWLNKMARRKTGFPVASIAFYGPDNLMATKVVVGILVSEQDEEVTYLEKWFNQDMDVRHDPVIRRQMLEFLRAVSRIF